MQTFNIHEAKTHFSELLRAVSQGEEILIAKTGVPIAKLVPLEQKIPKRHFGILKEKLKIPKDFDAPLPYDILKDFEG